ncbi:biotin/lipoyl-containing protein, partial [Oligella urethralis]
MSNLIEVKVPDIGDFDEVDVIEVLVAEGDRIEEDQSLITVESDKASMEIPSSAAGVVKSLKVKVGDKVSEGTVLLELEPDAGVASASEPSATAENKVSTETAADTSAPVAAASASAAPADASGGVVQVVVPDIGDFDEVDVIEVLVNEGDTVQEEQSLITVESDKASMEIPSSHAGRVVALRVKVGDKVAKGSLILELAAADGS